MPFSRLLILLALTATASSRLVAQTPISPSPSPAPVLDFPERVGAFVMSGHHVYETPDAGASARYSDSGPMKIDVYIYPVTNFSGVAPGAMVEPERALAREVMAFKEILDSGVVRGWWEKYQIAYEEDASLDLPAGPVPGFLVMTVLQIDTTAVASAFYIFDIDNQFVKIRINTPFENFGRGQAMTDFQEALIAQLANEH